eukprot:1722156-Prorocentrum_lima.AAC.1
MSPAENEHACIYICGFGVNTFNNCCLGSALHVRNLAIHLPQPGICSSHRMPLLQALQPVPTAQCLRSDFSQMGRAI